MQTFSTSQYLMGLNNERTEMIWLFLDISIYTALHHHHHHPNRHLQIKPPLSAPVYIFSLLLNSIIYCFYLHDLRSPSHLHIHLLPPSLSPTHFCRVSSKESPRLFFCAQRKKKTIYIKKREEMEGNIPLPSSIIYS